MGDRQAARNGGGALFNCKLEDYERFLSDPEIRAIARELALGGPPVKVGQDESNAAWIGAGNRNLKRVSPNWRSSTRAVAST